MAVVEIYGSVASVIVTGMMSWIILIVSGMFEAGWAITLPKTEMFTRLWPSVIFAVSMVVSVGGLAIAMRHIPTGPGYAVWAGVGAVTTAAIGMMWLGEDINLYKILSIALIVSGIVGLSLLGEERADAPSATNISENI
ncbi:MAG TPA: multidrug efflux SMR transporter [Actinomycetales bacterium]|nr:multidrug efflux SMR transporter [Actinomycetales bacterium]